MKKIRDHVIPFPDWHYLEAARGWLELGNLAEALAEFRQVSPAWQHFPAALEFHWLLCAEQGQWDDALASAQTLLRRHPEIVSGWIHQAYALRRVKDGGLEKARAALLPAVKKFPKEDIIPYNLACYEAQLGNEPAAWDWLRRAFEACGDVDRIKRRALQDDDLKLLWDRLKSM